MSGGPPGEVVVRVAVVHLIEGQFLGATLLEVEEPAAVAAERLRAWVVVRGYDQPIEALARLFTGQATGTEFRAVINVPAELLVYLTRTG